MINLFSVTIFSLIVSLMLGGFSIYKKIKEKKNMKQLMNFRMLNMEIVKSFESYIAVLEYHMNRAYDIIFKDQIMIYSIEATKLDDKHFEEVSKQFITLVLKLIGPMLEQEFGYLYGNRDTLLFNITEYFNRRYEDDEVRRASQKNLINGDEEDDIEQQSINPLML